MRVGCKAVYSTDLVDLFFRRLAELGRVSLVCKRLGLHPKTPTTWRKKHPEFAKRWEEFKKA